MGGEGGSAAAHHKDLGEGMAGRQQLSLRAEQRAQDEVGRARAAGLDGPLVGGGPPAPPGVCRGVGVTGEGEGQARTVPGAPVGSRVVKAVLSPVGPEEPRGQGRVSQRPDGWASAPWDRGVDGDALHRRAQQGAEVPHGDEIGELHEAEVGGQTQVDEGGVERVVARRGRAGWEHRILRQFPGKARNCTSLLWESISRHKQVRVKVTAELTDVCEEVDAG